MTVLSHCARPPTSSAVCSSYRVDKRYCRKDGSVFWAHPTAAPVRDADGRPRYIIGQLQDISAQKRAEEALRTSELRYRSLVEQLPAIVYTADLDATSSTTYVSPQIEAILGFTPEEWSTDPELWLKQLHPDDHTDVVADIGAAQHDNLQHVSEYRALARDGRTVWLRDMARVVCDDAGQPLYLQGITFDITARKQAEEAARRSEERFRRAFDLGLVGMAITLPTREVFEVNDELCTILRYQRHELEQLDWVQLIHPDDASADMAKFARVLTGEWDGCRHDLRFVHKDGHTVHTTMAVRCVGLADGSADSFVVLVHDISDRVRAVEALRRSEARYRALVEHFPRGAVFLVDHDLRLLIADGEAIADYGYARAALVGRTLDEVLSPEAVAMHDPHYRAALQGVARMDERSFGDRTFVTHYLPIPAPDGTVDAAMAVSYEVTDQKRTEAVLRRERELLAQRVAEATAELRAANAELARAARLKDEFLASMSHELRTPLNAVLGLSESLREQTYGGVSERQDRVLGMIEDSGRHLLSLINDILDVAKIGADKLELERGRVSVAEVCETSLHLVRQAALRKRLSLQLARDPQAITIHADTQRLKQILVNLLSNAVKFTPDGGQVGLEVVGDVEHHVMRFMVWDTGIGIAPEEHALLFQPFVQLDNRLAREYTGTGLGLVLVAQLAELHGGHVSLESARGTGSRFTVTLPWQAMSLPADVDGASNVLGVPASERPQGERATILLADDNAVNSLLVVEYLGAQGYHVVLAQTGVEAVELARSQRPALILMDVQMPELDGLEAVRRMRAVAELRETPILMLTALAMEDDRERCLAAGADGYLSKPVPLRTLAATIAAHLAHTRVRVSERPTVWGDGGQ